MFHRVESCMAYKDCTHLVSSSKTTIDGYQNHVCCNPRGWPMSTATAACILETMSQAMGWCPASIELVATTCYWLGLILQISYHAFILILNKKPVVNVAYIKCYNTYNETKSIIFGYEASYIKIDFDSYFYWIFSRPIKQELLIEFHHNFDQDNERFFTIYTKHAADLWIN